MNVLLVSIAFPPKNDPECLQTARIFSYLCRDTTMTFDVVTSSLPTLFMPVDETLVHYDHGYRQKIALRLSEHKLTNFLLRKTGADRLMFPDSKMTFHWQWKKVVKSLKGKPDLIYSRSNPVSSAFMAMKLKAHYKVPWVMHFSDPWVYTETDLRDERKAKGEAILMSEADMVTFTTDATLQLYTKRYPLLAEKFDVIPNVFDPEEKLSAPPSTSDKFRMVYTGGLAGDRSLYFLDDVLQQLSVLQPGLIDFLEIIVAGPMDRHNAAFFDSTSFRCIKHVGTLDYNTARNLQQSADMLLVVDSPKHQNSVFFPSKLLDYFLTGKMIMACSPVGSTTRKILEDYPFASFNIDEHRGMAEFLIGKISQFKAGERVQAAAIPSAKYSAQTNAIRLAKMFKDLVQ